MKAFGALLLLILTLCVGGTEVHLKLSIDHDDQIRLNNTEQQDHQVTLNFNGNKVKLNNAENMVENKDVAELKKERDNLVKDLDQLRSSYNDLNEQKGKLKSRYDQLMSGHLNLTEENDQMLSSFQQLLYSHTNLSEHHQYLQSRYNNQTDRLQSSLDQLKISHDALNEERDQLQSRYNNATEERGILLSSLQQLQSRCKDQTEQKGQLQSALDQLKISHSSLNEEKDKMHSSLQQLQSRYTNQTEQLQSSLDQLKISHDALNEERDQLQSRYSKTAEQKEQLQSTLDQLRIINNNLKNAKNHEELKRIRCESDGFTWDRRGGVCYLYSKGKPWKTWNESRRYCKAKQADLFIMNSQRKLDFIVRIVPYGQWVWIGLTDRAREGSYRWVDGTRLTSPTFWRSRGNGDCVYYYTKRWQDISCSRNRRWMCERVFQ